MRVAVVGATGLVGSVMLSILEERKFKVSELIVVASEGSVGKEISFGGKKYKVVSLQKGIDLKPDVALFSAGGTISTEWAPKYAEAGAIVIDNSSAWRMDPDIKLVVPEINAHELTSNDRIIANPNCSTIQMVMVLNPLHKKYGIRRVIVSTYQSVTGTGAKALKQLADEQSNTPGEKVYPHPIHSNVIPQCDVFVENGYTKEEMKMVNETQKILNDQEIKMSATAVRVPVKGGHSESINVQFNSPFEIEDVKTLLSAVKGVTLLDDPKTFTYPMPLFAEGKDEVFVGRLRRDLSMDNTLNMWVVADNLRKGAATNAVQIAEYLVNKGLL